MSLLRAPVPLLSPEYRPRPAVQAAERPHIGLLILFGPEVRAFLHSGLAERLARSCRVSVITSNTSSAAFCGWERSPQSAPREIPSKAAERMRRWNQRLHLNLIRHRYGEVGQAPKLRLCQARILQLMGHSFARLSGRGQGWKKLYERLGLDCLIAADYASPSAAMALQEAERKGIATVVLTNSWKDVYAHPYVDVPAGWIGVAGEREAAHLRCASPHLRADRIAVVGSLHLEHFLRRKPIPGRAEFCRGAGLDPVRPFLCYTAASPQVAAGEESIVHTLLEAVEHHPARPQVLLRLNPRENGERFRTLQARFPDCIIQRPVWEWDANKDWNAPLREDLELWIATVHHAAFNVSIPSTVSFEFAAMGRLVVNVCFGGESPARCANTWDAPFYRQIRKSPFVAGAFSVDEFREMVAARLREPGAWRLAPPRPVASPVDEAEKLVWAALEGRGKCRPMELQLGVDHAARRVAARTGARAPAATGAGTNDRASALHLQ